LDTFKLSTSDQEALMAAVNEFAYETLQNNPKDSALYTTITQDILLDELKIAQNALPFVGLRHFDVDWLGNKGYHYDASFALINYLEDKGVINLSKVENPKGDYQTTKISLV
jgi:hypothetical protein